MYIEIEYSDERLWGKTDPEAEKLDSRESGVMFSELVRQKAKQEFPGATVSILHSRDDFVKVDNKSDSEAALKVVEIIQKVWSSWDWMVTQQLEETEK